MFNDVSITATALFDQSGTYTREPSGDTATPTGFSPVNDTVATTVFVAVSITAPFPVLSAAAQFPTYTREPSGDTATPTGLGPSVTVATTVFVAVSITEMLLSAMFDT